MMIIRLSEMTTADREALCSYIEKEVSCHAHDDAMTWEDFVETADSCIPDDWNDCEIEVDDDDFQELRVWAQGLLADYVDIREDERCENIRD